MEDIQPYRRAKSTRVPPGVARPPSASIRRVARRITGFDEIRLPAGGTGVVALLTSVAVIACGRHRVQYEQDQRMQHTLVSGPIFLPARA